MPPDLAQVVAWPSLPDHIKAAIHAITTASSGPVVGFPLANMATAHVVRRTSAVGQQIAELKPPTGHKVVDEISGRLPRTHIACPQGRLDDLSNLLLVASDKASQPMELALLPTG